MKNIANLLGIKSNERLVICDRSLSVIDSVGAELFRVGDILADHLCDETKAELENLISGKAAPDTELCFQIHGMGETCFAVAGRHILFSESILMLRLYAERREYLSSEHFIRDVLSEFTKTAPDTAPFLMHLYDEMKDGYESETPSIDAGQFLLKTASELRSGYDYPHCEVKVEGARDCFIRDIPPEALVRILLSMFYVADRVSGESDVTVGAYGSDGVIVLTANHTVLPVTERGVASLVAAAPGCAAAMLAMELTAAKYGFETACVVRGGMVRLSLTQVNESKLTAFKSWDQFALFDEILRTSFEEMKPILFQQ